MTGNETFGSCPAIVEITVYCLNQFLTFLPVCNFNLAEHWYFVEVLEIRLLFHMIPLIVPTVDAITVNGIQRQLFWHIQLNSPVPPIVNGSACQNDEQEAISLFHVRYSLVTNSSKFISTRLTFDHRDFSSC